MRIVIDIDESLYKTIKSLPDFMCGSLQGAVKDGILLSDILDIMKDAMQVKALEQDHCDDCISKKAVLGLFNKSHEYSWEMSLLKRKIEEIQPVTSVEKVGKWTRELIRNERGGCIGAKMICSECGQDNGYDKRMKFCPNCGAKMEV